MSHWHDDEPGCSCDDEFDPATVTLALPPQPDARRYQLAPMTELTEADRTRAADLLDTVLVALRTRPRAHVDAIAAALASERAAAVADLRARVEAVAEDLERPGSEASRYLARRIRAAVTDTTGDPA